MYAQARSFVEEIETEICCDRVSPNSPPASKPIVKRKAQRMSLRVAKTDPITGGAESDVGMPLGGICVKVAILNADPHIVTDREAQTGETLVSENRVAIASVHVNPVHLDFVGVQDGGGKAYSSAD